MKILISNDDGVHAPGIKSLTNAVKPLASKLTVVAPLEERSTTGHTLSLDNPLRLVEIEENTFGCSGYPADCSLMGFAHVLKDDRPDLILSGINRGANLGQDIYYSGTVAAAREAIFHGHKAIAISSVIDFHEHPSHIEFFDTAANFLVRCLKEGITDLISPMSLVNINVPNIPEDELKGVELTTLGFRKYSEDISERKDFRNRSYYWVGGVYSGHEGGEKTDCFTVEQGKVSITILNLLGQPSDNTDEWSQFVSKLNS